MPSAVRSAPTSPSAVRSRQAPPKPLGTWSIHPATSRRRPCWMSSKAAPCQRRSGRVRPMRRQLVRILRGQKAVSNCAPRLDRHYSQSSSRLLTDATNSRNRRRRTPSRRSSTSRRPPRARRPVLPRDRCTSKRSLFTRPGREKCCKDDHVPSPSAHDIQVRLTTH
jgi:hypothetical protein